MKYQKITCYIVIALLILSCSKNQPPEEEPEEPKEPEIEIPVDNGNDGPSPDGDIVGQITVGYQAWFSCNGDNSPMGSHWWHWTDGWQQIPAPDNFHIPSWPDNSDYENTYKTNLPLLGNGNPASLFSSFDDQTIDVHFQWMKNYGIHTAALQRFNPDRVEGPIRNAITEKIKDAAEKHDVKFYIMYDVTGWTNMQSEIKTDWLDKMQKYTESSAYAKQNEKPVVGIWGFGFNDSNHSWSAAVCLDVIRWFRDQGCYIMGGVPTYWRTGQSGSDCRSGYLDVFRSFDMISPWMVGRISNDNDCDRFLENIQKPDFQFCAANDIDYQPCVMPGDLQAGLRRHGDFMWRQFYNFANIGVRSIYISMFDEYNEANQIAKTAETQDDVPTGLGIKSLDEDGTPCSSDYYLRLTNDGGKMIRGEIPVTEERFTIPIP